MAKKPIQLLIVGAGNRGSGYAEHAEQFPDEARVVAVADPIESRRNRLAKQHGIARENIFDDWRAAADRKRLADAVVIATQDHQHADPALAFIEQGYDVLLEKPMAPTEADCRRVARAALDSGVIFTVCHVLRYTRFTRALKELLRSGAIGDLIGLQRLEPVGHWHMAHSFVRGNWRNEAESSPMLLAKSCHDIDWISHVVDAPCRRLSSFGSLRHFRRENQPAGAADRCLDCAVENACPYSAKRIYLGFLKKDPQGWPLDTITADPTEESVLEALRQGPYGRCVYACDNDVVDNQVVNMEFEGGRTASFTMSAFTQAGHRRTTLFGTRGEVVGDGERLRVHDFLSGKSREIDTRAETPDGLSGHGGGDFELMRSFLRAVSRRDPGEVPSGAAQTLESHLMVFAAERARREGRVVEMG